MTVDSADRRDAGMLLGGYQPGEPYDELLDPDGALRTPWRPLAHRLHELRHDSLIRVRDRVREMVDDDDITYNPVAGGPVDGLGPDTAQAAASTRWRLDALPMLFDSDEWDGLARGVAQRSALLDAVLKDLYGPQRAVREQIVPPEVVFGNRGFIRRAVGVPPPGPKSLFLHAVDLGRTPDGNFAVFADRTQAPSGVGYALAGRRILSRSLPRMFRAATPRSLGSFAQLLRGSLVDAAPNGVEDPTIVVLSPGSYSETAFDQAHLASVLGVPLVEAGDLTVRDGGLHMRALGRMKRVDVVLRRVDSEFSDPLDLRTDSRLGVVGLVELMTRGAVSVVNTLGSGVLESPALHPFLPELCRVLLDEDLLLPSTPTHHLASTAGRAALDQQLDSLVLTRIASGERVLGRGLDGAAARELRARVAEEPELWVAQEVPDYSTAPSLLDDGAVAARGFGMRTFSVAQESGYAVMGGGLGQVLSDAADGTTSGTAAAKDVWVPISEDTRAGVRVATLPAIPRPTVPASGPVATPRVLSDLFWMGRYAERAEAMVRMLGVASERTAEYRNRPWQAGAASLQPWLDAVVAVSATGDALGPVRAEGPDETDVAAALRTLTLAPRLEGSVTQSFTRVVGAARAVRDQMSTGTWTVLGGAERALHRLDVAVEDDGAQLDLTLADVLVSLLAFSGLARESMVRDPGWLMMDAGRRIERSLQLVALTREVLVAVHDPDTDAALIEGYLIACESSVTYRRRHRSVMLARAAVDLMYFDESNPRSLIYQLHRLRTDLAALPDELRSGPVERIVEEQIAQVGRFDPGDTDLVDGGRRAALDGLLGGIADALREVSDVLERTRFAPPGEARPLWSGTMGGE
ncbi:circularly permuted type 2 ATP-grasp protein [Tsukamurella sp. 8F]|uniref:circularly permuted type 2 ATP-grasp protein n=1 Tax=unclassified Tsukamurella TaxID=2633480 RepID=UPI0023B91F74|nr:MULTISPECIES: circularly permuted type 2 ATP-grasp protein [unclassified Tsukamurella]MDF0529170.1 circularly permuted type 2 ATP-grasp protein [Tsukamurella sp. 8J]MDF0585355.1 circularly permuted type 2 ATP-grasp protein [Tsukamurella sp. 8F]